VATPRSHHGGKRQSMASGWVVGVFVTDGSRVVKDLLCPVGFTANRLSGSLAWDPLPYQLV